VHPDKRPEMMLYEIAVDEGHRRRGIATALVDRLSALGRERGCPSMFVFADDPDPGAQAFYAALAPARRDACVMFTWE
jgi:ribosomal protein S18 acetylase RimI-like enzyme